MRTTAHTSSAFRSGVRALVVVAAAVAGLAVLPLPVASSQHVALAPQAPIGDGAAAAQPAVRAKGPQPVTPCQQIAYNVAKADPGTTQVIVVLAATTTATSATVQVAELDPNKGWVCGTAYQSRIGLAGVRPLADRRSGDGTTPAGVFPLARMTAWDGQQFSFFGNSADPGVTAGPYRRVKYGDCFGSTPNHPDYGHLVYRAPGNCGGDDEYLPGITGAYSHAALIGANMEPDVSGDAPGEIPYASAIFLHRYSYDANGNTKATHGCVSMHIDNLRAVLRAMKPGVRFAIGQTDWLLAHT